MQHFLKHILKHQSVSSVLPMVWLTDPSGQLTTLDINGCEACELVWETSGPLRPGTAAPEEPTTSAIFQTRRRVSETPEVLENMQRVLAGETLTLEVALDDRMFEVVLSPFRDVSEAIVGALGVVVDVTRHSRLQTQLRQAHKNGGCW